MVGAHIGHDCHVGNNVTFANIATLGGHCVIGDYVVIGGSAERQAETRMAADDPKQADGRDIVRVHRRVFAGEVPMVDDMPNDFSGRERIRSCR